MSEQIKKIKLSQKIKVTLVAVVLGVICFGFIYSLFSDYKKNDETTTQNGYNAEIPDGNAPKTVKTKQEADETGKMAEQQRQKTKNIQESADTNLETSNVSSKEKQQTTPDNIVQSQHAYKAVTTQLSNFNQAPRQDAEVERLKQQVAELSEKLNNADNHKVQDPIDMMERSYQLASKYFPQSGNKETMQQPTEKRVTERVRRANDGSVSMLNEDFELTSQPRNYGFHTAVGGSERTSHNSIKACISSDQVITTGSRVKLRLLDALQTPTMIVPVNTEIYGEAQINGQRMSVTVSNIEYAGNIIPVELNAHDMDGQKGIFVPNSMERTALKEAAASIGAGFGNSISFTSSAGQQLAMDAVRGVMNGGTQYIANKVREVKISVKANYNVLLITKK